VGGGHGFLRLCNRNGRLVAIGQRDPGVDFVQPRVVMAVEDDYEEE